MPKRRITKQQHAHIKHLQEAKRNRASKQEEQLLGSDQLGPEQQGLFVTHYGKYGDVECKEKIYRCHFRQNLGAIVVGDGVIFRIDENQQGIIVARSPRDSLLWHMDDRDGEKPIAANIDQMIIVIAPQPKPTPLLINSYLVAAEHLNITALILINKIDLFENSRNTEHGSFLHLKKMIECYKNIGYPTLEASAVTKHGVENLEKELMNHSSVFIGQSGVGKSSLIDQLLPHEALITGHLHESTGLGRHTTTTSRLYHLPRGGELIDSPGIREFCLWKMEPQQIAQGFREFRPFIEKCKFRNCRHIKEPDCAVMHAVESCEIESSRWDDYKRLVGLCASFRG